MIGPVREFSDLPIVGRRRAPGAVPMPDPVQIGAVAVAACRRSGLDFQVHQAVGRYLEVAMPDGGRRRLARVARYALARPDEVREAVAAIVGDVADAYGPGRVWSLLAPVHYVAEYDADFKATTDPDWSDVDGVPHVLLRSWICHENGPQHVEVSS